MVEFRKARRGQSRMSTKSGRGKCRRRRWRRTRRRSMRKRMNRGMKKGKRGERRRRRSRGKGREEWRRRRGEKDIRGQVSDTHAGWWLWSV